MGSGGGMMGGDAGAMGTSAGPIMPGSEMGMAPGMMAGASPASSPSVEPVLIVKLTMQGDKQESAADCVVSVIDENGANLLPVLDASYYAGTQSQPFGSQPSTVYRNGSIWMGHSTSDGKVGGQLFPGMQGTVRFGKATATQDIVAIEPGRYTIRVEFNDGHRATRQVVIPPHANAKNHTEHIVCPGPSKNAYVVIHTPILPQELIDAGFSVVASVKRKSTTIEGTEWQTGYRGDDLFLDFDPKTGAPTCYVRNSKNNTSLRNYFTTDYGRQRHSGTRFENLATQDRFLTLPSGDYEVTLGWWDLKKFCLVNFEFVGQSPIEGDDTGRAGHPHTYAAAGAAENGVLTIHPDTRDVLLDFPEGMLEAARAALKTKASTTEATTSGVEKKLPDNVLLNFTATWCGPCQQMIPIVDKLREQGYAVRHVDVDRERSIVERFGVTALPSFIRLSEGQVVGRQTGATSEAQLVRLAK